MEKNYEIPNYLLTMLKEYKSNIKYGTPSLDGFLEGNPNYENYVRLIKKYTKSDIDFKAIAGKFLIDGEVTGYDTKFDEILTFVASIDKQIGEFVDKANELVISGSYFGKPYASDKVSRVFLRVRPNECSDNIEIYTYVGSSLFTGLFGGVGSSSEGGRLTVIELKEGQGCIEFSGLNACKLYSASCSETIQGEATKYMEDKLYNSVFQNLLSTLNGMLYRIWQKEENPMDILIK